MAAVIGAALGNPLWRFDGSAIRYMTDLRRSIYGYRSRGNDGSGARRAERRWRGSIHDVTGTPSVEQQETIKALLAASARPTQAAPIRREFVQKGDQRAPLPGPLSLIVRGHDERALDVFLLHRAIASKEPWDVTRDYRVWARTLGLPTPQNSGSVAVAKVLARLDGKYNLVRRERAGRSAKIIGLCEDGSGAEYTSPPSRYFKLSFAYWLDPEAWYRTLSFPAKALLLIALSLKPGFLLPAERGPEWYGISADTVDKGLRELRSKGLLDRTYQRKQNWLSPTGQIAEYRYTVLAPFHRRPARHLAAVSPISTGATR